MIKTIAIAAATLAASALTHAFAAEHEVKMLNKGSDGEMMVFEPAYLEIAPGDTLVFLPTHPSHNAESILAMAPEDGETFRGALNKEVRVTLTKEGVYGVKCLPHYGLGMIALIKVGDGEAPNLEAAAAVKHPGRAKARMETLFERVDQDEAEDTVQS